MTVCKDQMAGCVRTARLAFRMNCYETEYEMLAVGFTMPKIKFVLKVSAGTQEKFDN